MPPTTSRRSRLTMLTCLLLVALGLCVPGDAKEAPSPVFVDCPPSLTLAVATATAAAPKADVTAPFIWHVQVRGIDNVTMLADYVVNVDLPLGEHPWVESVSDPASGTTAVCAFVITVVDTTIPALTCPADIVDVPTDSSPAALDAAGDFRAGAACSLTYQGETAPPTGCSIAVATQRAGAWAGRLSLAQSPSSLSLGLGLVDVVVVDAVTGHNASCAVRVLVVDGLGPRVGCPAALLAAPVIDGRRTGAVAVSVLARDIASGVDTARIALGKVSDVAASPATAPTLWSLRLHASPPVFLNTTATVANIALSRTPRSLTLLVVDGAGNTLSCGFQALVTGSVRELALLDLEAALVAADKLAPNTVAAAQQLLEKPYSPALSATEFVLYADLLTALVAAARRLAYDGVELGALFHLFDSVAGATAADTAALAATLSGSDAVFRAALKNFAADVTNKRGTDGSVFAGVALELRTIVKDVPAAASALVANISFTTTNGSTLVVPASVVRRCADSNRHTAVYVLEFSDDRLWASPFNVVSRVLLGQLPTCAVPVASLAAPFVTSLVTPSLAKLSTNANMLCGGFYVNPATRAGSWRNASVATRDIVQQPQLVSGGTGTGTGKAGPTVTTCTSVTPQSVGVVLADALALGSSSAASSVGTTFRGLNIFACIFTAVVVLITVMVHLGTARLRFTLMSQLIVNMGIAIAFALVLFVVSALVQNRQDPCQGVGVFVHYFWLAAIFWLLSDAVYLYEIIVKDKHSEHVHIFSRMFWLSWGVPVLFVAGVMIAGMNNYAGTDTCWIEDRVALIVAFFVPLGVSIVAMAVLFLLTFRAMLRIYSGSSWNRVESTPQQKSNKSFHLRGALVLYFELSAAWIAGALHNTGNYTEIMQYLFAGLIVALGLSFILLYWILDPRVHAARSGQLSDEELEAAEQEEIAAAKSAWGDGGDHSPVKIKRVATSVHGAPVGAPEPALRRFVGETEASLVTTTLARDDFLRTNQSRSSMDYNMRDAQGAPTPAAAPRERVPIPTGPPASTRRLFAPETPAAAESNPIGVRVHHSTTNDGVDAGGGGGVGGWWATPTGHAGYAETPEPWRNEFSRLDSDGLPLGRTPAPLALQTPHTAVPAPPTGETPWRNSMFATDFSRLDSDGLPVAQTPAFAHMEGDVMFDISMVPGAFKSPASSTSRLPSTESSSSLPMGGPAAASPFPPQPRSNTNYSSKATTATADSEAPPSPQDPERTHAWQATKKPAPGNRLAALKGSVSVPGGGIALPQTPLAPSTPWDRSNSFSADFSQLDDDRLPKPSLSTQMESDMMFDSPLPTPLGDRRVSGEVQYVSIAHAPPETWSAAGSVRSHRSGAASVREQTVYSTVRVARIASDDADHADIESRSSRESDA